MKRREFLVTSVSATTTTALGFASLTGEAAERPDGADREYYEWRAYRLKPDSGNELIEGYLQSALLPALNRLGSKPIGVFKEIEPKSGPALFVLIPYPSLEAFATAPARLTADTEYQNAGSAYLKTTKDRPGFVRIDSWLLRAFAGMPKLEVPGYAKERKPRLFELRTYESYSEEKALKKVEMFNDGEIQVMREVQLGPIFFGQALAGANLPHLTYMLSAENRDDHKQHWGAFGKHAGWKKMSGDAKYADTVSKIASVMLEPMKYSQL